MFERVNRYLPAAWLAWILLAATKRLIRFFPPPDAQLNGDAYWTYLPNARKLLEHPWAFLTSSPESYHVAPLGYMWAAVWGAIPERIQLANCALFLICVLLMWRCASKLGGTLAGIVATGLMVYHPQMATYIPQVLTESIYLFGLMLGTTAAIEYTLSDHRHRILLGLASVGLTITLLSRPVLQLFALGAFVGTSAAIGYFAWHRTMRRSAVPSPAQIINRRVWIALLAALMLPTAVVVKNGLCFGVWGLGTGAGSGLYYGVSPFKMGLEPVYSGFNYDAGITPLTADPSTNGHPLTKESDHINGRVAIDIVKNTSFKDNAKFFIHKVKAWLFYSTPELLISHKLRSIRSFEWISIGLAILTLTIRARKRASGNQATWLQGLNGKEKEKLTVLFALLILVLGMTLQLAPVLYNTRYNIFFLEPWLMLLSGVGVAMMLRWPAPTLLAMQVKHIWIWHLAKVALLVFLALLSSALTRYAVGHETWGMDPYRPGPTAVLLDRASIGSVHAINAVALGNNRWRLNTGTATLIVPLHIAAPETMDQNRVMDALWRIRLAVTETSSNACKKAKLTVSPAYAPKDWYEPEPSIPLRADGQMHTYASHANDQLRPAGNGNLYITFSCPDDTIVTWSGAELLKSTLPEAARALIQNGTPINPYLQREPR